MSTIQMKRQGGGAVCNDATAKVPSALSYGEIAVDCFGNMYCGDGKQQVKSQVKNAGNVLFTYKGTLNKDSWSSSGEMYTQTITVSPIDGGPDLTADFVLSPPMAQQSENFSTNQITQEALGLVNQGKCIPGKKEVTCKVFSKPTISFDIYWYARVSGGYSSLVDSGQLQNSVDQAAQALSSKLQSMIDKSTPQIYYGTFSATGWQASNSNGYSYVQTINLSKANPNSKDISSSSVFLTPGFFLPTGVANTDAVLSSAMGIINGGYSESGNNSVTTRVTTKPTCDITVRWVVQGV